MSETFLVWDTINGSREDAHEIEADGHEEAAEQYADEDHDGQSDGIYSGGQPIAVVGTDGVERLFRVVASYDVSHHAYEAKAGA